MGKPGSCPWDAVVGSVVMESNLELLRQPPGMSLDPFVYGE